MSARGPGVPDLAYDWSRLRPGVCVGYHQHIILCPACGRAGCITMTHLRRLRKARHTALVTEVVVEHVGRIDPRTAEQGPSWVAVDACRLPAGRTYHLVEFES